MGWNLVDAHLNRYEYLYYRITLVSIEKKNKQTNKTNKTREKKGKRTTKKENNHQQNERRMYFYSLVWFY